MIPLEVSCPGLEELQGTVRAEFSQFLANIKLKYVKLTVNTGPLCIFCIPLHWIVTFEPARATAWSSGAIGLRPPLRPISMLNIEECQFTYK